MLLILSFKLDAFDFNLISFQSTNRFAFAILLYIFKFSPVALNPGLVLEDFFYIFSLFEPTFLCQVPMRLIFYVFTFPQRLLMSIYRYGKNFSIFITIIIYFLRMKGHCISG